MGAVEPGDLVVVDHGNRKAARLSDPFDRDDGPAEFTDAPAIDTNAEAGAHPEPDV